jgi:hypothetical protein
VCFICWFLFLCVMLLFVAYVFPPPIQLELCSFLFGSFFCFCCYALFVISWCAMSRNCCLFFDCLLSTLGYWALMKRLCEVLFVVIVWCSLVWRCLFEYFNQNSFDLNPIVNKILQSFWAPAAAYIFGFSP